MTRFSARLLQWKHKALKFCSKLYRESDELNHICSVQQQEVFGARFELEKAQKHVAELQKQAEQRERTLAASEEARQNALKELMAERALRNAAEERAERYHEEALAATKDLADWFARTMNRRPVFGKQPEPEAKPAATIPSKQTARERAQKIENDTLRSLAEEIHQLRQEEKTNAVQ